MMLTLAIRYLNGWAMAAADGARKEQAEWPPHPDRLFMALAAAWFETGEDAAEGAALSWLESQDPPAIAAADAAPRHTAGSDLPTLSFVPVNDTRMGHKLPEVKDLAKLKDAGLALLPEQRSRQPRRFPTVIPDDPVVRFVWQIPAPEEHRQALTNLAGKVTHVGHSASLVQAWIDEFHGQPNWVCIEGIAEHRLRVPSPGRLDYLTRCLNRSSWNDYHDLEGRIQYEKAVARELVQPPRSSWDRFPDVLLLATESAVKGHPRYPAAKAGDAVMAAELVSELVGAEGFERIERLIASACQSDRPLFVAAHAYERFGVNAIPAALAELLSERLDLEFEPGIVQTNVVSHTGADGFGRLARQACFDGSVHKGREYLLVDDFVGQGGTLANLRGHIMKKGGRVAAAIALTGKPYSATLTPTPEQLRALRDQHGKPLETWWREHFGHPFDRLTQSEARYLTRTPDVDRIRDRIAAAKRVGDSASHERSPREQKRFIAGLELELSNRFPNGPPVSRRPEPGRWQGYSRPDPAREEPVPDNLFDPSLVVLSLSGRRLTLSATLKLTEALRGALMKACGEQPPPEWFSGHQPDGRPSQLPHLALLPLPFVDHAHADGRIMGLALALPAGLDPRAAARCLEPFLRDDNGLPRPHRLFDGQWLECGVELETRESPPKSLRAGDWTRPARTWASVTPVALDRHFDGRDKWERAAEGVKDACERIGLPRPREVLLHPVSLVEGAPHGRDFPPLTRKGDGGRRHHSHAVILFDQAVRGPLLIGAGRFRGYGLCRPLDGREVDHG